MSEGQSFWKRLISATGEESSKRFVVIALILFFLFLNFSMALIQIALFFHLLNVAAATVALFYNFFEKLVFYDYTIICFGIGAIALVTIVLGAKDLLVSVLGKRAEAAMVAAENKTPQTQVNNANVEKQNVGPNNSE